MMFKEALGEVLRELRTEKGLTLRQISKKANVALGYLSEIERGHKEASSVIMESIAYALGVPTNQIVIEVGYRMGGWEFYINEFDRDKEFVNV